MKHDMRGHIEHGGVNYVYSASIFTGDESYTYPDTAEVEVDFGETEPADVDYDHLEELAIADGHKKLNEAVNDT